MKLFVNVQVSAPECFVLKEEREPLQLVIKMTSHMVTETGTELLFLKYNFYNKTSQLHEGSLKVASTFPLNKKEKLIVSQYVSRDDF